MSLGPEVRRGGKLPFGMVAARWMCDPRYSANARALYAILVTYADTQTRETGRSRPYRKELAAQLGVSVSTVDRTLVELEVAGLIRIERRKDPDNPANNEASVYHLLDYPVMYAGNGEWVDPLGPDQVAADVAKVVIEERRAQKREQGAERRGGVPKGVNPKAVREAKQAAQETSEKKRGSSMGAARGSSTHAARVAAPVLPNLQNPVHRRPPEPEAPSARSAPDGRRPSDGSSVRAGEGGSAASSNDSPSPEQEDDTARRREAPAKHTRAEIDQAQQVAAYFPAELGIRLVPVLTQAILDALAGDVPNADRTAAQLGARIGRRWEMHGYADKHRAGGLASPVGAAIGMVRPLGAGDRYGCANPRCEDGADVDTGEECAVCPERIADRRAQRRRDVPVHRPSPSRAAVQTAAAPRPRTASPVRVDPAPGYVPAGDYASGAAAARALMQGSKAEAHRRANLLPRQTPGAAE